jgi:hypothetical protein
LHSHEHGTLLTTFLTQPALPYAQDDVLASPKKRNIKDFALQVCTGRALKGGPAVLESAVRWHTPLSLDCVFQTPKTPYLRTQLCPINTQIEVFIR